MIGQRGVKKIDAGTYFNEGMFVTEVSYLKILDHPLLLPSLDHNFRTILIYSLLGC